VPTLLYEIGCEELPAAAVYEAEEQLPGLTLEHLGSEPSELYLGPRRLAVLVRDLPAETEEQWVQGPPVHVGEKAAAGFARKLGVPRDALVERDGVLGWVKPPEPIAATLPARLEAILQGLSFAKSMTWRAGGMRFSRPVRWTLALLDGAVVVGDTSYGHRFTASAARIPTAEAYAETLREHGVEPSLAERERLIREGLDALGGWRDPMGKLREVVNLVERPLVLEGSFDERFLALPEQVVTTAMQSHQRYFPLGEARFAFVANGGEPELVRAGNERVLEGRLDDATFTFERDVAVGIDGLAERLGAITFVAGAGSMADKTARLERLVDAIGGGDASREAARLAKADQAAELVREFPDLEGAIGAEYTRLAGYPEAVCAAIEEQYLPDSAGGPLPATEPGRVLAVAEKIDNLTVAFSLGQRPTGTRDPYGLRRAAIGLCRLAGASAFPIDVARLVAVAHRALVEQGAEVPDAPPDDVAGFVAERLEGLLDVPVEFVRAARRAGLSQLGQVAGLARALAALPDPVLGAVHTVYTRSDRLAGKQAHEAADALDSGLLVEEAERDVAAALDEVGPAIDAALGGDDFPAALSAASELGPPLDRFFVDVLVMAEDAAVRGNRLRLLLDVRDTVGRLGDFTQIPR
jgi:tetrameric-type glycyl-tRNA synthetase beta subunit